VLNIIFQVKINQYKLLDYSSIERVDSQKMHKIYDNWPELAAKAYNQNTNSLSFDGIDHIIFAGMGGSGALGDIFAGILSKRDIHVSVVKGYHLPKTANHNTLVITTSISGNTVETLSVLSSAVERNCRIAAFSSGGIMEKFCSKNNITYNKIDQVHSPRASFSVFLFSMLKSLESVLSIDKHDTTEALYQLKEQKKNLSSDNLTAHNPAISLASWIKEIPMIYYPWGLQAAAIRFKNSLQENAKLHVVTEDVIEACHNGIVSWEKRSVVQPILIEGYDDYIKTKERLEILKRYFDENEIDYREVKSTKGSIISKLINLIYFLDYVSIYKAILSGVDPSPVKSIDYIKSSL